MEKPKRVRISQSPIDPERPSSSQRAGDPLSSSGSSSSRQHKGALHYPLIPSGATTSGGSNDQHYKRRTKVPKYERRFDPPSTPLMRSSHYRIALDLGPAVDEIGDAIFGALNGRKR
jgi:hypothetical protein